MTVVDSRFRVHGTPSLRLVDASGVSQNARGVETAVYLICEKASDVIIEDTQTTVENQDRRTDHSG